MVNVLTQINQSFCAAYDVKVCQETKPFDITKISYLKINPEANSTRKLALSETKHACCEAGNIFLYSITNLIQF